jgi:hypothetical protein
MLRWTSSTRGHVPRRAPEEVTMSRRSMTWAVTAAALLALPAREARAQVKAGAEFRANTYVTSTQDQTAIAVEADGDFVVVWESSGQDGNLDAVAGQRFNRDGSPRGDEFVVNTYTIGSQNSAEVAVNRRGRFVIVWESTGQDGNLDGIFGQRYDASGNRAGAEFQINTYSTGSQLFPSVGIDAAGNFMVVWYGTGPDGNLAGVVAQRFDSAGAAVGGEFVVNSYTVGSQDTPKIAMHADGRAVVVWESFGQDGNSDGIFGQRFDAAGSLVGAEFQVNTYTTGSQDDPLVAMAADGGFVVVWEANPDLNARRYDASGNPVGAEFLVNSYTTNTQFVYGMAMDQQGNFIVAWEELGGRDGNLSGVFGQRFTTTDAFRGPEFLANTYTTGSQGWPALAADEVGNYVVVWQSPHDTATLGVFGQRFGGLFPNALAVDTAGNSVLEPGEAVDVRPAWRNHNGGPVTITGTLTGIDGPPGATYAITDATADYGTVPDNADSDCGADCYGVSVSNPTPRPVQHWDASALESLAPDAQGQQKRWALHVGRSFGDVAASNPFYRFVETLLHHGVTGGCSPTDYCPASSTTRQQMAVFVLVAKEGAGYAPPACGAMPMFADVPASSPFCRWVEELARRGVVTGCGGGNFCPTNPVTREQMAVFVLRTLDPSLVPPACTPPNIYADVPETSAFCRWIEELTNRGVVTGCGGGNYCPTAAVTRQQMGVFISVTFGLTLYGP